MLWRGGRGDDPSRRRGTWLPCHVVIRALGSDAGETVGTEPAG